MSKGEYKRSYEFMYAKLHDCMFVYVPSISTVFVAGDSMRAKKEELLFLLYNTIVNSI